MNYVWSVREVKEEKSIEVLNVIIFGYMYYFFVGICVI